MTPRRCRAALAAARPRIVFHLAAQPIVRLSYRAPLRDDRGQRDVRHREPAGGVRAHALGRGAVVVITSDKCYENREREEGYREDEALGGHDPYSASKRGRRAGGRRLPSLVLRRRPDRACATVRAGNVIGGGDWAEDSAGARRDPRLVRGEAIRRAQSGRDPPVAARAGAAARLSGAGRAALHRGPRVVGARGTSARATRTRCRCRRWSV